MQIKRVCLIFATVLPIALAGTAFVCWFFGFQYAAAFCIGASATTFGCWLGYNQQINLASRVGDNTLEPFSCPTGWPCLFNCYQLIIWMMVCLIIFWLTKSPLALSAAVGACTGALAEITWSIARRPTPLRLA
jgi:hypothetical protein